MSKILNQSSYVENGQFSGGQSVTASAGNLPFVAGGLYVGTVGDLEVKTIDGSQFILKNVSGFVPGLIAALVSGSNTTAADIIALK
jgi:hypothetical protein